MPKKHFKDAIYLFFVEHKEENKLYQMMLENKFNNLYHFEDEKILSDKSMVPDFIVLDTDFYMQEAKVKKEFPKYLDFRKRTGDGC